MKNRRKDGGYYWVVANVSPVREHGQVVGYQSVRSRPSREEVDAAEAVLRQDQRRGGKWAVSHGRGVRERSVVVASLLSMRAQMAFMGVLVLFLSVVAAANLVVCRSDSGGRPSA